MGLIILNGSISPAQSQIIPDATLDEESSSVTPNVEINGTPSDRIDGGAARGANLFHSFSEFNIGEGQGAYFTNPMGIENILGRVTGVNPSEILGRLGVIGGDANLFLINPNGIIFGENASLDVGGSFMATTADSIGLGESGSFNATEPQTSNLLSINPSVLFFNAMAAQSIVNRSQAANPSGETNSVGDPVGLQVAEGKSLALIGGDVLLEEGNVTAMGGRIELGSVAGAGRVSLEPSADGWLLGYEGVQAFGDIRIEGALADASEGSSKIETGNLVVSDGGQIFTDTFSDEDGGDLNVNATESIELIGTSTNGKPRSGLFARTEGNGNAGNLTIATKNLIVRDSAAVSTLTENDGDGGNLKVNATESIELIGISTNGKTPSGLFARTEGNGNAGNLTIATKNLIVRDGAAVSTRTENDGDGGNLKVNVTESIELIGTSAVGTRRSGLFADTKASGNAGNINLSTKQLTILDGAAISSESRGIGNAGNLNLDVSGTLLVDQSNITSGITSDSTGDSGNIFINADNLQLSRCSQISTNAANTDGGSIFINTDTLKASNNSDITANAQLGNGGIVVINAEDIIGTEARDSPTPQTSDITAYSELGIQFNGIVSFNGLAILPNIKLPQEPVKGEVVQSCQVTSQDQSVFTVTGKGGIPSTPSEYLRSTAIDTNVASSSASQPNQNITQSKPIVEAQGWIVNERGNVVLTANSNDANPVANFSPDASGCSQP
jgi:filamentous hemagglutinin family protein